MTFWGWRDGARTLALLATTCNRCGGPTTHRLSQQVRTFSAVFVPLHAASKAYLVTCTVCEACTPVSRGQADACLAAAQAPLPDRAATPGLPWAPAAGRADRTLSAQ
jgi:hypothetical protein